VSPMPTTLLFLHPSAELYGADRTLLQLVEGLDRARWRAVVALPRRGVLADALEQAGAIVEVGELGIGARGDLGPRGLLSLAWRIPRSVLFVRRLAAKHRPSLVHTNTMVVLGGAFGAKLSPVRHLWHVHEILERPRWLTRAYAHLMAWLADEVVSNSRATRSCFDRWYAPLAERHSVILNGVDGSRLSVSADARARVRSELGIEQDAPLVLLVGRVNSWKGQSLLVDAAHALRDRHPRARYVLVGDAPPGQAEFEQDLDAHVARLGLQAAVQRVSFRGDVASLYAAADLCVVPSTRPEPFGLVAVEAMALARPVVAANHGGLTEIIVDGQTGTLVTPGDSTALAAAIGDLLADPERARQMGVAGRARQREKFTVARYVDEFARRYVALTCSPVRKPMPASTRIVHLVFGKANPERANGVNRVVHQLASAQVLTGRDVEVWGMTPTPDAPTSPRPYRLRCFKRGAWRLRLDPGIAGAIDRCEGPVVFHLHGGLLPEMALAARRIERAGHTYSFTPHGAYRAAALEHRAFMKRVMILLFDRRLLSGARAVQAFNDDEATDVARLAGSTRVVRVPNGQDRLEVASPEDLRLERPVFGFLGRLSAHTKGLDVLLDGFARYAEHGSGTLVLVGDGADREALEQRARALGIEARVVFVGALFGDDKFATVAGFDAFVHPSRHEGQPGAVLEAAALGLPLVVAEGTGLAREVTEAGAGFALASCTPDVLARALHDFAEADGPTRRRWADGARRMVAEGFSWSRIETALAAEFYGIAPTQDPAVREAPAPLRYAI
jgi:glycosyltransferase involved in cell wall biosynthesis